MEEGLKHKKTVFVGGISDDTNETTLYEAFSTFGEMLFSFRYSFFNKKNFVGDIIEVQLPPPASQYHQNPNPNGMFANIVCLLVLSLTIL